MDRFTVMKSLVAVVKFESFAGAARAPADLVNHDCLIQVNDPVWHFVKQRKKFYADVKTAYVAA